MPKYSVLSWGIDKILHVINSFMLHVFYWSLLSCPKLLQELRKKRTEYDKMMEIQSYIGRVSSTKTLLECQYISVPAIHALTGSNYIQSRARHFHIILYFRR